MGPNNKTPYELCMYLPLPWYYTLKRPIKSLDRTTSNYCISVKYLVLKVSYFTVYYYKTIFLFKKIYTLMSDYYILSRIRGLKYLLV